MFRSLDSSPRLSRFLLWLSTSLAKNRGVPMLLGTVFIVLSCISFGVVIPALAASDDISSAILWLCIPLGLLHFGLFVGFLGFMLAAPLGEASRNSD